MRKLTILLVFGTLLICSCKKYNDLKFENDSEGNSYLLGRLFLTDTLTQRVVGLPLPKKKVYLSYNDSPDSLNYLFNTVTDDEGYFSFKNLNKDKLYRLYFQESATNGGLYSAKKINISLPNDTLSFIAGLDFNKVPGIYYNIIDKNNNKYSNVDICIFSNISFFNAANCLASDFKIKSDTFGRAYQFNIPNGLYYANFSYTINNKTFTAKDTFNVQKSTQIKNIILTENAPPNGFQFLILDTLGFKISNAQICIFTSKVLFNGGTCDGFTYQVTSDQNGIATLSNIPQNRYFVYVNKQIPSFTLSARDSLDVGTSMVSDTLILK